MRAGLLLALALALLRPGTGAADDRPGYTARFLGWNPSSGDFAYVLDHHRRAAWRPTLRQPRSHYFLRRTSPSGVAQLMKLDASVAQRAARLGYRTEELEKRTLSPREQAFSAGHGCTLRIELEVGSRKLSYSYWLDDPRRPDHPKRLLRGYLNEVWTEFDAHAFVSPDREWLAIVLSMSTPYRRDARVEGVRVCRGE